MIGMQIAQTASDRLSGLVLICTSATMDPSAWNERIRTVREKGMAAIADLAMGRFLSAAFSREHPAVRATVLRQLLAMDPEGYAACGAAIRDMALIERLPHRAVRPWSLPASLTSRPPWSAMETACSPLSPARAMSTSLQAISPRTSPPNRSPTLSPSSFGTDRFRKPSFGGWLRTHRQHDRHPRARYVQSVVKIAPKSIPPFPASLNAS